MKLVTAVLFIAVASYLGVYLFNALRNTFATMPAIPYTVEESFSAEGFVVRTETVMYGVSDDILPIVSEGERVAVGQTVAVEYLTDAALETASEIRSIRLQIAQIEAARRAGGAETDGLQSVMELSRAVQSGDLRALDELSLRVETTIFAGDGLTEYDLPALQSRLEVLEARRSGMISIDTSVSGIFSQTVDGFENVLPQQLFGLSPLGLTELFYSPTGRTGGAKIITEFKWYYAAIMDEADAMRLALGRTIVVQFSGIFNAAVEMTVESIGRREDGEVVVIFSSNRGIHDITMPRQLQAEIIFGYINGIRVPKEAIHLDDDAVTHVFLHTGARAERVNVEILAEIEGHYIVRDGAETGSPLRVGSSIIVRGNNLFDGRVVS
jgi:hypothetical protein